MHLTPKMPSHLLFSIAKTVPFTWIKRNAHSSTASLKKHDTAEIAMCMYRIYRRAVALKDLCASHRSDHAALGAGAPYIPPTDAEMLAIASFPKTPFFPTNEKGNAQKFH